MASPSTIHLDRVVFESTKTRIWRGHVDGIAALFKQPLSGDIAEGLRRIQYEHEVLAAISDPGVVQSLGIFEWTGIPVLALKDSGGVSIREHIGRGKVPLGKALDWAAQLADALIAVHRGAIVHRDINPANIVVNESTGRLQIIDFELALKGSRGRVDEARVGELEGTIYYLSPEQTGRTNRRLDERTDLFSVGVVLFELLSGNVPFRGSDQAETVHRLLTADPPELRDVPVVLTKIVRTLLQKRPEDRYATAAGLALDLKVCRDHLERYGLVRDFEIRQRDVSSKFVVPERIIGREPEISKLVAEFKASRVSASRVVLLGGPSGIGKSAIVGELRALVRQDNGIFVAGKFDQYRRNVPFMAVAKALDGVCDHILRQSPERQQQYRTDLERALGSDVAALFDVVPALEQIIGKRPRPAALEPEQNQNRLRSLIEKFAQACSSEAEPLVMFLDDMQWADTGSLEAFYALSSGASHFLVICAYRDNEVDASHPFVRTLRRLEEVGKVPTTVEVGPLGHEATRRLVADTVQRHDEETSELARVIGEKTANNPFHIRTLLNHLYEQSIFEFSTDELRWTWNLDKVRRAEVSGNVVELVLTRLRSASEETQGVLAFAACMGREIRLSDVASAGGWTESQVAGAVAAAVRLGALDASDRDLKLIANCLPGFESVSVSFVHDRVQQAAHLLVDENQRKSMHRKIGLVMLSSLTDDAPADRLFEVVDHLNIGRDEALDDQMKQTLADLNLKAGEYAQRAGAYGPSLDYFNSSLDLRADPKHEQSRRARIGVARAYNAIDRFEQCLEILKELTQEITDHLEAAQAYEIMASMFEARGLYREAINSAQDGLARLGLKLPRRVNKLTLGIEVALTRLTFGEKAISLLERSESVFDKVWAVRVQLASVALPSAYLVDPDLCVFMVLRVFRRAFRDKYFIEDPTIMVAFSLMMSVLKDGKSAKRLGALAKKLKAAAGTISSEPLYHGLAGHWIYVLDESYEDCSVAEQKTFDYGMSLGDPANAGMGAFLAMLNAIGGGVRLPAISALGEQYRPFFVSRPNSYAWPLFMAVRQSAKAIQGGTDGPDSMSDGEVSEQQIFDRCQISNGNRAIYSVMKAWIEFNSGQFGKSTRRALTNPVPLYLPACFSATINFAILGAGLILGKDLPVYLKPKFVRSMIIRVLALDLGWWDRTYRFVGAGLGNMLRGLWKLQNGKTSSGLAILGAGLVRLDESKQYYWSAWARETAGRILVKNGMELAASGYLAEAARIWSTYGIQARHDQLLTEFPKLALGVRSPAGASMPGSSSRRRTETRSTTTATVQGALDVQSITKAAMAISGELDPQKLSRDLLSIAMENAGADYGVLVLSRGQRLSVELRGRGTQQGIHVEQLQVDLDQAGKDLPLSIARVVFARASEVIVSDLNTPDEWSQDGFFAGGKSGSGLGVPIVAQGSCEGLMWLENSKLSDAFTEKHLVALRVLAAQGAISMNNALHLRKTAENAKEIAALNAQLERILAGSKEIGSSKTLTAAVGRALAIVGDEIPRLRQATCEIFMNLSGGQRVQWPIMRKGSFVEEVSPQIVQHENDLTKIPGSIPVGIHWQSEKVGTLLWTEVEGGAFDESESRFIETLVQSLALALRNIEYQTHLQELVDQRTAELAQALETVTVKSRKIQAIMDHIQQGILTINHDLAVEDEHSAYMSQIFGRVDGGFAGAAAMNLLAKCALTADQLSMIEETLKVVVGDDLLNWELNGSHLPTEVSGEFGGKRRVLQLDWNPIASEGGIVERMLLSIRDVTLQKELQKNLDEAEAAQQRKMRVVSRIMAADRIQLGDFIKDALVRLKSLPPLPDGRSETMRILHTIKGSSRILGFVTIATLAHTAEDEVKTRLDSGTLTNAPALDALVQEIEYLKTVFDEVVGEGGGSGEDWNLYRYAAQARRLVANMLEQSGIRLERFDVSDEMGRWPAELRRVLLDTLPHCLNNAVDHGFVSPKARGDKVDSARIQIESVQKIGRIDVRIIDHGAGIDYNKLAARAQKLGISGDVIEAAFHESGSDSSQVTMSSGRGVGMGAVRSIVRKAGGDVRLLPGTPKGSICMISLPMTETMESNQSRDGVIDGKSQVKRAG
jgi:predicted ATPase/GAF domain-containing protein